MQLGKWYESCEGMKVIPVFKPAIKEQTSLTFGLISYQCEVAHCIMLALLGGSFLVP